MSMSVLKKLSTILFPNTEEPYQVSDPTAVKFDAQELTESQQMQARTNIAAVNSWDELTGKPFGSSVQLVQGETKTQQGVVSSFGFDGFGGVFPNSSKLCRANVYLDGKQYILNYEGQSGATEFWGKNSYDAGENPVYVSYQIVDAYVSVIFNDDQTHTVSVTFESEKEVINPIPSEYLPSEEWTFTLEDGSTVTKKVVISE